MNAKKPSKKPLAELPVAEELPVKNNRRPWYIALLATGFVLFFASTTLAILGTFAGFEQRVFEVINNAYLPGWVAEQVAKPISNAVWGMGGLVVLLLAVPKFRLMAWQYLVAAGSTYVLVFITEHLVDRARPIGLASYEVVLRAAQGGPGFPSGHVAVLTALCLTAWPFVAWPWRVLIVMFVAAEAWSRVYLGLHAPLDIIGGIAAAMVVVGLIHLTPAKIRKVFKLSA